MRALKAVWRGWRRVARTIGHVQVQIIMTLFYFVIMAPYAVAVRLFMDPLNLKGTASWRSLPWHGGRASLDVAREQF